MPLSPPTGPQPPLMALRAFEAAARHQSFNRAAEELSVTPGAIAQQIRKLEEFIGARLFDRHANGVRLNRLGAEVLPDLTGGFDQIGKAARRLRLGAGKAQVSIAALPAIAQLWLGPRLSDLTDGDADIEISVHALDRMPPLSRGGFDLALYPMQPDGMATVIARNWLVPVAAPAIAAQIERPADLADVPVIHDLAWSSDMQDWLAQNDLPQTLSVHGPTHSLYSIALDHCLSGKGVLIGHTALIQRELDQGRLVALFPETAIPGRPICLIPGTGPDPGGVIARLTQAILSAAPA